MSSRMSFIQRSDSKDEQEVVAAAAAAFGGMAMDDELFKVVCVC